MPTVIIPPRTVVIENDEIKKIVNYFVTALTSAGLVDIEDKKHSNSELQPGEQKERGGWWVRLVTTKLEAITGSARGSKEVPLGQISIELDGSAFSLREAYINYLNLLFRGFDKRYIPKGFSKASAETEKAKIYDRVVLVRELLIRMVTVALSVTQSKKSKREPRKIVPAIRSFCAAITHNKVLNESLLMLNTISNIDVAFETSHIHWINVIDQMVEAIASLNAHAIAIGNTFDHLIAAKRTIVRQIIGRLSPDTNPTDMSDDWLSDTLSLVERRLLSGKSSNASDIEWINASNDWNSSEVTDRQKQIIALIEKDCPRISALYQLFAETNLYIETISCVSELFRSTGWVLLLTGVLNVKGLGKLIDAHGIKCNEILTLEPTDPIWNTNAGKGIVQYHAGTGSKIEIEAFESSKSLAQLRDPALLKKIGKSISNNISALMALQPRLKGEIVNNEKLDALQSSSIGQQIFGNQTEVISAATKVDPQDAKNNLLKSAEDIRRFFSNPEKANIKLPSGNEIIIEGVNDKEYSSNHGFISLTEDDLIAQANQMYDRVKIVELLKQHMKGHANLREFISRDIEALYLEFSSGVEIEFIPEKMKNQFKLFKLTADEVKRKYQESQALANRINNPAKKQIELINLNQKFTEDSKKNREKVWAYCTKEKTIALYLKEFLINDQTVPYPQGSIALFGQILQIKIHLFQVQPPDANHSESWLQYIDTKQQLPNGFKKEVILLRNVDSSKCYPLIFRIHKIALVDERRMTQAATALVPAHPTPSPPFNILRRNTAPAIPVALTALPGGKKPSLFSLLSFSTTGFAASIQKNYTQILQKNWKEVAEREEQQKLLASPVAQPPKEPDNLASACQANNVASARKFLANFRTAAERTIAINSCMATGGKSPFHHAVINGNEDLMRMLYQCGADPGVKDENGYNAMHHAVKSQLIPKKDIVMILDFLLEKNKNLLHERASYGKSLLHIAAETGNVTAFKWLTQQYGEQFDKYVNLAESASEEGDFCLKFTALHHAAAQGHLEIVIALLNQKNIKADIKDAVGKSALYHAICTGSVIIAEVFYSKGIWLDKKERAEIDQFSKEITDENAKNSVLACLAIPTVEQIKLEMPESNALVR